MRELALTPSVHFEPSGLAGEECTTLNHAHPAFGINKEVKLTDVDANISGDLPVSQNSFSNR
jgi:hypothetical protein